MVLPSSFDIHEWDIMRRFCGSVESSPLSEELLDAIHGSGVFRMFRATIYRHEIQDDWYAFRGSELERIAIDWLEANEVPYVLDEADEAVRPVKETTWHQAETPACQQRYGPTAVNGQTSRRRSK